MSILKLHQIVCTLEVIGRDSMTFEVEGRYYDFPRCRVSLKWHHA